MNGKPSNGNTVWEALWEREASNGAPCRKPVCHAEPPMGTGGHNGQGGRPQWRREAIIVGGHNGDIHAEPPMGLRSLWETPGSHNEQEWESHQWGTGATIGAGSPVGWEATNEH
jgi:hypothetical protein